MEYTEIASPSIRQALVRSADANGTLGYRQFLEIALYHPEFGYYRKERKRVGRSAETDFFTATSFKAAFAAILVESSLGLLKQAGIDPAATTWVEIGAEPGAALLDNVDSPFAENRAIGIGEPIDLEGNLVVFSNELFDAQPFHRLVFRQGAWLERAVEISETGLREIERRPEDAEIHDVLPELPDPAPEGYSIDLPTGSRAVLSELTRGDWRGAFIALDYGKTWKAMTHDTPQGTARAYSRHSQSPRLLEAIGEQDLTCHICWDWLEADLADAGFGSLVLESQESFVLKRAPEFVASVFNSRSVVESDLKGQLRQLVHPTLMGQKFQSLSGLRTARSGRDAPS